jgi:histidine triad (HIT) family protein
MTSLTQSCEFCQIISGQREATVVAVGPDWIAFFPLNPATPGHTLVVPKSHVQDLWQAASTLAEHLMIAVLRVGHAIDKALRPDGLNVISSAGTAASQSVFHLHLHIVPRWHNDAIGDIWPSGQQVPAGLLNESLQKIRAAYAAQ